MGEASLRGGARQNLVLRDRGERTHSNRYTHTHHYMVQWLSSSVETSLAFGTLFPTKQCEKQSSVKRRNLTKVKTEAPLCPNFIL